MKSANRRILLGFIVLIAVFSISEYFSLKNLEKSKEISSRNARIFQPSIIYLDELKLLITDSENYTSEWVFFDISDHASKNALREIHKKGSAELTKDLVQISKLWDNAKDEKYLDTIVARLDSIMIEQQFIMSKLSKLQDYSKENWLVLIEVEDEHLANVKSLSSKAKNGLQVLITNMKERSLKEKDVAQDSFRSIQNSQVILTLVVIVIFVLIAWSIIRFLKSEEQKKIITEERDEIQIQKAIIEEKNSEIMSSINYAERLQKSMLPSREEIASNFSSHFIFYRPRDIVSGDFYWHRTILVNGKELTLIAAADATGHGVPGAFVSFICYSSLNRAVDEFKLYSPGEILDKVSELVSETFTSSDSNSEVYDGMDVSLCVFDFQSSKLHFSGANNSAYVLRDNEMNKLSATRKSVGRGSYENPFIEETWDLQPKDSIFLLTDGFQDQFGGEKSKKYRTNRLLEFLAKLNQSSEESELQLEKEFNDWKMCEEQIDDVLIIGLTI